MRIFQLKWSVLLAALALVLVHPALALAVGERATAELRDGQGQLVGQATFIQQAMGVHLIVEAKNLTPGLHGLHIHAVGKCEPPDFTSAGPHFNPLNKQHGLENPEGPHAGDLPNLEILQEGAGKLDVLTERVTLTPGPVSLFDKDGSALVIHASADDQKTDPSGNSGGRVACGVLQPSAAGPGHLGLLLIALAALLLAFISLRIPR